MDLSKVRLFVVTLLLSSVSMPAQVWSQSRSLMDLYGSQRDDATDITAGQGADEARQRARDAMTAAPFAPLEGPIDPETYLVGPNDQFTISVGGIEPKVTPVQVAADGGLIIPAIGRIETAGKTLAEVDAAAREMLGSSFKNVEVGFALNRPREFWVHVGGAIPQPGRYLTHPVGRVEDVLNEAFLFGEARVDLDGGFKPALRNVQIRHRDGTTSPVDLVRYYRTGDTDANPYLRDGDAIVVPSYDPVRSSVFVSGDVPFPGNYDLKQGDTVLDVVQLGAGNLELEADRRVRLIRRDTAGVLQTWEFTIASLENGAADAPMLEPLDHVSVVRPTQTLGIAAADGMLQNPGHYPIEVGVTTLTDLIQMAGGFRDDALMRGAYLERGTALQKQAAFDRSITGPTGPFEIITDSSSALWQMRLAEFDFLSRQFLARWLRMDGRVSIDIAAAVQPDAAPVYLLDGDRLFVPRDEQSVYVVGEVVRPGRTPVAQGRSAEDYIAAAGGRGPRASDTFIIRAGTGQVMPAGSPIGSGDYLFVNRKGGETASIESERLRILEEDSKIRNRQAWFSALTAAAAVVTTTILVIREVDQ